MKVYLLQEDHDYDGNIEVGVFSTIEAVSAYVVAHPSKPHGWEYQIVEFDLDAPTDEWIMPWGITPEGTILIPPPHNPVIDEGVSLHEQSLLRYGFTGAGKTEAKHYERS